MDNETLALLTYWVNAYAVAAETLRTNTVNAVLRLLVGFRSWYSPRAVSRVVDQARKVTETGEQAAEGLAKQYVGQVASILRDGPVDVAPITVDPVRNGADPVEVLTRPIEVYRRHISVGDDEAEAERQAFERMSQIVDTNMTLVGRDAEVKEMKKLGFTHYRRVIHPERSAGGTCGLCIAASTRVYHTDELMPLHGGCHCTVLPIENAADYGDLMNGVDLDQLYIDSGGTSGPQLKRTRYKVNEHGEYGLVLGRRGDSFRGPKDLGKNDPIGRAKAELSKLEPTLKVLQAKAKAGQDVSGPLEYQLDRIAKLNAIIAAA